VQEGGPYLGATFGEALNSYIGKTGHGRIIAAREGLGEELGSAARDIFPCSRAKIYYRGLNANRAKRKPLQGTQVIEKGVGKASGSKGGERRSEGPCGRQGSAGTKKLQ